MAFDTLTAEQYRDEWTRRSAGSLDERSDELDKLAPQIGNTLAFLVFGFYFAACTRDMLEDEGVSAEIIERVVYKLTPGDPDRPTATGGALLPTSPHG